MTPSDIIRKVRRIEIRTRKLVTDSVTGAYHSSFKGRGMDFEEVREAAIGDDVRTIDWNVSAKMDRPFIKVYREERELTLMLLIDLSASGLFGSVEQRRARRRARQRARLSATRNNDKVGLLLYTDEVEHYIPPGKAADTSSASSETYSPSIRVAAPTISARSTTYIAFSAARRSSF